jgi:hypothetical protein
MTFAIIIVVAFLVLRGGKGSGAAEKYKAELRAKGEKISFQELGFPLPPADGSTVKRLTNAVNRLPIGAFDPSTFVNSGYVSPGRAVSAIRFDYGILSNQFVWDNAKKQLDKGAPDLEEIRQAVESPVNCFLFDPISYTTNLAGGLRYPFVPMRNAAQWLAADAIVAFRESQRERGLRDLHAVIQLSEFNNDDITLVAQMIRVAIGGLGLGVTWHILQDEGLTEGQLASLQRDWERVDFLQAHERGMIGERAFGEAWFANIRKEGADATMRRIYPAGRPSLRDHAERMAVQLLWKRDEDERFLFAHYQKVIEMSRNLRSGKPWPEVQQMGVQAMAEINKLANSPLGISQYEYPMSLMCIPNFTKASQTCSRHETQRRLTITAIALKRFELRGHRRPKDLTELVPNFLGSVSIDPMSGQVLRYRLNPGGTFVLYSVGEDGKDDGGDPTSAAPVKQIDLWSGRDAVWPVAVEP